MNQPLPRVTLLIVSFVQGMVLLALYRAFDTGGWPSESPLWSFPLTTLAIAIPLFLLLALERGNERAVVRLSIIAAVVLTLTAVYTGSQAEPFGEFGIANMTFSYVASITLACFKGLMYLQQRAARKQLSYQVLFTNSWRNFLVTGLSAVFAGLFFLVLTLWGALFNVIGIEFFSDLFQEEWFVIPILAVAFGLAVVIFRDLSRIIDSITRLLHGLIKLLLPLIVVVAVIFLAALPLVGFDALWSTRRGTFLLLCLLAAMLFFTNAVYQDGREPDTYARLMHRLIYAGLCFMPFVSALSLYGLYARIDQYGWTVERACAVIVWALLSLIAIGYVIGIVRRRDNWPLSLARVNTVMGLVVLGVMLLANTPLLDLRKLSIASQLARVERGEIELRDFDYWYADRNLGRPGYLAIERIKEDVADSDADLLALIENPRPSVYAVSAVARDNFWEAMVYRPEPFTVPDGVRNLIDDIYLYGGETPVMLRADLDRDGQNEYVLFRGRYASALYHFSQGQWRGAPMRIANLSANAPEPDYATAPISSIAPRYPDLMIGGVRLSPMVSE